MKETVSPTTPAGWRRWMIYQRERFPFARHGPLVAVFSFAAVGYSRLLRGEAGFPEPAQLLVAFITALLFFLQLRIADEFKDYEEDARYRPYRAVPRGLVTLRELGWIGFGCGVAQLALALWLHPPLLGVLALAWLYLGAMSREFFVRDWLTARPVTYLWTHMLIMPLIDLYATACDWLTAGRTLPPDGLYGFLIVSFFNGILIEIGRKLRAPADEEEGVRTYTVIWGRGNAVRAWCLILTANLVFAGLAAGMVGFLPPALAILVPIYFFALFRARCFLQNPTGDTASWFEFLSGIWTLVMYPLLGLAPFLMRALES